MPWITLDNAKGRVYVPECGRPSRHNCPDCYACQFCDETRCAMCIRRNAPGTVSRCSTGEETPDGQ